MFILTRLAARFDRRTEDHFGSNGVDISKMYSRFPTVPEGTRRFPTVPESLTINSGTFIPKSKSTWYAVVRGGTRRYARNGRVKS